MHKQLPEIISGCALEIWLTTALELQRPLPVSIYNNQNVNLASGVA